MRRSYLLLATTIMLASCSPKAAEDFSTAGRLAKATETGKYMYAHQDDLNYGHTWYLEEGRSDVRDVCGKYPAIIGFDMGRIELGDSLSLDKVPFDYIVKVANSHIANGGIVTFSWHPRNPLTGGDAWDVSSTEVVKSIIPGGQKHEVFMNWLKKAADLLESVNGGNGIIFRPWHENYGNWFWWGGKLCTDEEYQSLWDMTYDYMVNERGLTGLLWAFSPNADVDKEGYMSRYPGDEIIDLFGLDAYQYGSAEDFKALLKDRLAYVKELAQEHEKLYALTETGHEGIPEEKWWTEVLDSAIKDTGISYVLTWRNACDMPGHFYGPFPGAACEEDFKAFEALDNTLFLDDINKR